MKRIQRKRTKGFELPPNTVCINRPTKWEVTEWPEDWSIRGFNFKELHKSSPYPETLFEFYQSAFTPYSEDKKRNFEAVKNNDEVKKLMQIDY